MSSRSSSSSTSYRSSSSPHNNKPLPSSLTAADIVSEYSFINPSKHKQPHIYQWPTENRNIPRRVQPSVPAAEFGDDWEIPRADVRVTNKWPRFVGSAEPRVQLRPQSPTEQSLIGVADLDAADTYIGVADLDAADTLMLTDKSLLDCPACHKPLRAPIYQCENGHTTCSICCTKAINVCLWCTSPIGFIRNVAMEKLADSILIYCKNIDLDCQECMIYHKVVEHEQVCPHTACFFPHPSCSFTDFAEDLYKYFSARHLCYTPFTYDTTLSLTVKSNQKNVFLQERDEGVIFILNHDLRENNRSFSVDCIGPPTFNKMFVYQLTAKHMGTCLSLQGVPEVFVKWDNTHSTRTI
ncbi:hypothetical protein OSB04_006705 [Centaurea solstitialis]|uniref:RING-type E3 ubiquitin transferase n=1 Tax=Centaurea solstitialis TaxID=347529 RepID=A0AA38WQF6_9ASTR|nr:hypothetical protein OSB04_006705 [Centaurea solstitialis]